MTPKVTQARQNPRGDRDKRSGGPWAISRGGICTSKIPQTRASFALTDVESTQGAASTRLPVDWGTMGEHVAEISVGDGGRQLSMGGYVLDSESEETTRNDKGAEIAEAITASVFSPFFFFFWYSISLGT